MSEQNLFALLDTLGDLLFVLDEIGHIVQFNTVVRDRLGYTNETLIGEQWLNLCPAQQHTEVAALLASHWAGQRTSQTTTLQAIDGMLIPVELHVSPGQFDGQSALFCVARDITPRLQAEAALRDSDARWQFALEGAGNGLWEWDVLANELHYSRQSSAMFGYTENEFGNTFADWEAHVHPDDLPHCHAAMAHYFMGETPVYCSEYRILCKDGTYKWTLDYGKAIEFTEAGTPRRVIGIHTDVTSRHNHEDEIRRLNATLEHQVQERTAQLEAAVTELKRAEIMKDEFMGVVTNELRTPLIGVLSMAEVLESQAGGQLNERQTHYVQGIHQSGERLLSMVNSILRYTGLMAGNVTMQLEPCRLAELCAISARAVRDRATQKGQTIAINVDPIGLVITSDTEAIVQMLQQLLDNAVKFTAAGGQIGVEVSRDNLGGVVRLVVWDTGIGVAANQQATIFAPFVQGDSGMARRFEGVGLGLAYVRRMVELLDGTIALDSTPGQGSRFIVTLPVTPGNVAEPRSV